MSDSSSPQAREEPKPCPPTEAPSPLSLPTSATITSFQILNPQPPAHTNNNPHKIDFHVLLTTKIDPLHRLKLLKWLHSQAVRHDYYRQVFAYAAHYLDRFMSLSEKVDLSELQMLAFGALLLATKIEGAAFPKLGKMFDINQILAAEIRITLKLNYFLHPKTYVHVLSDLTAAWDRFADREEIYQGQRYLPQSLNGFQRYRSLHEKMECVYMAPQSHKFPISNLAFNLFFLQNKVNVQSVLIGQLSSQELLTFISSSYNNLDEYGFVFQQFQLGFPDSEELDLNIGVYLASFMKLPVDLDVPNRRCANYDSYLQMQTSTEDGIKGLDRIVRGRKERERH